jgi:hypothetical protein
MLAAAPGRLELCWPSCAWLRNDPLLADRLKGQRELVATELLAVGRRHLHLYWYCLTEVGPRWHASLDRVYARVAGDGAHRLNFGIDST